MKAGAVVLCSWCGRPLVYIKHELVFRKLPDGRKVHAKEGASSCYSSAMRQLKPVTAAPPADMDVNGLTPRRRGDP